MVAQGQLQRYPNGMHTGSLLWLCHISTIVLSYQDDSTISVL